MLGRVAEFEPLQHRSDLARSERITAVLGAGDIVALEIAKSPSLGTSSCVRVVAASAAQPFETSAWRC